MVTRKEVFTTQDGKKFESFDAARAHEMGIEHATEIHEFLDRHYPQPTEGRSGPARSIVRNALAKWLAHKHIG